HVLQRTVGARVGGGAADGIDDLLAGLVGDLASQRPWPGAPETRQPTPRRPGTSVARQPWHGDPAAPGLVTRQPSSPPSTPAPGSQHAR
ncbi:hypothetical protein ACWEPV_17090, partial [Streptomyces cacaoi]